MKVLPKFNLELWRKSVRKYQHTHTLMYNVPYALAKSTKTSYEANSRKMLEFLKIVKN
jgi:hypothetical protein